MLLATIVTFLSRSLCAGVLCGTYPEKLATKAKMNLKKFKKLSVHQNSASYSSSLQFLITLSIVCSYISPMASAITSAIAILPLTNNSPTVSNRKEAPRWSNDNSSAADNATFKNKAQNIEFSFGCVARSAVLLKSKFANTLLFNLIFVNKYSFNKAR